MFMDCGPDSRLGKREERKDCRDLISSTQEGCYTEVPNSHVWLH